MANNYKRLRVRRGHTNKWKKSNPLLRIGEVAVDLDLHKMKIGNGVNSYNELPYLYDELYFFIQFILKMISNIEGSGKILNSIQTKINFSDIENPENGDIVFVINEDQFYYYNNNEWVILSLNEALSNKLIIADNIEDLYNEYNTLSDGTSIFVKEDSHTYIKNNNEWIKQANYFDTLNIMSVISKSDLDDLINVQDGAIVFVLSEKKYYSFNGTKFVKNKIL